MVVYQGNVRGLNQLTDCNREATKLSPTEPIETLLSLVTHAPRRFPICSLSDKPSTFHNATITPVQSFKKPTCGGRHERLLHLTVLEGGRKGKLFLWEILSYLACTRLLTADLVCRKRPCIVNRACLRSQMESPMTELSNLPFFDS